MRDDNILEDVHRILWVKETPQNIPLIALAYMNLLEHIEEVNQI